MEACRHVGKYADAAADADADADIMYLILMVSILLSGRALSNLGKRAGEEVEERKRSDTSRLFSNYFGKPFLFYNQNEIPQY